ncbi:MAG TPA: riboflavin synthase [Nitrospinota bacterium]|nr:riboflavin synthase [Nitrospinota bacterium]|tara:strand:- start:106971 stop:107615 length:645 start_codon:yes stop_codon:yes gene_type:complete
MFTGIIEGLGEIKSIRSESKSFSLDIDTGDVLENPSLGESVAIDGVCLTIEAWKHSIMSFDVSKETLNRTTFNDLREGNRVNLERAMRLGDRVGGHIVQGHVDSVGTLVKVATSGNGYEVEVEPKIEAMKYIIEKGSIAISGISLTVAKKNKRTFSIAIIPHTWETTTLKFKKQGSKVNIECDMIAKYVENLVKPFNVRSGNDIDESFLGNHGF